MNKGELKTVINSYSHRTHKDNDLNGYIDRAALKIGRDANLFEAEATHTFNTSTVINSLPVDFLMLVSLHYSASIGFWPLKAYSIDQLRQLVANDSGAPKGYTMESGKLHIAPLSSPRDIKMVYQQRIPALAVDSSTNDILTGWENTYVYGAVLEAGLAFQDSDLIQTFKTYFDEEVIKLAAFADAQRLGAYSAIRSM